MGGRRQLLISCITSLTFVCRSEDEVIENGEDESNTTSTRWFHISDSHVKEVSERTVLEAQAYLLFYERVK